ncbi:hypothetical protein MAP00_000939 [Monascus purpureus]|nr:hypothetical protein MAP00_000939 [Monascus purpureus]
MLPIATVFDGVASQYPEAVAVQFEKWDFWTYVQLQKASVQIAKALGGLIAHGQQVAVLLPRSPAQIAAILAILRLGGQDALLPPNVDRAWLIPNSPEKAIQVLCRIIERRRYFESNGDIDADEVAAAVFFTSGSTGLPKGVRLTHQNLLWPAQTVADQMHITVASRVPQFYQCSFDAHLIDILSTILYGRCLLQVSQENLMSDLTGWIRRMNPNTAHFTPSTISILDSSRVPSIKRLVTPGEPISQDLIDRWVDRVELMNLYGLLRHFSRAANSPSYLCYAN